MQPVVASLKKKCSKNVDFVRIDVDAPSSQALTRKYGVSSIPRYILLNSSGKVILQWSGAGPASQFNSMQAYCAAK